MEQIKEELSQERHRFNHHVLNRVRSLDVPPTKDELKSLAASLDLSVSELRRILKPLHATISLDDIREVVMKQVVPLNRVVTYGTIARVLGYPNHYRQVANLLASARGIEVWACRVFPADRTSKQGFLTAPDFMEVGDGVNPSRQHWLRLSGLLPHDIHQFKEGTLSVKMSNEWNPS